MIPAVISATTEMTAIVEKRGTARVASGQRSAPANTSPRMRKARPPVQTAAATTWTTSDASPSAFKVLAWPEKDGVTARPALSASVRAVSGRRSWPSE